MKGRLALCLLAVLSLIRSARATPVDAYSAIASPYFTSSVLPAFALDDGRFPAGKVGPTLVTYLNLGFFVTPGTPAAFDIRIDFFDSLDPNAAVNAPVNSGPLGGITIPILSAPAGVGATGLVDLTGLPGGGILFPDNDWAVQVRFRQPESTTMLSDRATPLFAGGVPAVGENSDRYWRDVNGNGMFEATELRTFGGAPNRAQFYLVLKTGLVPEPGTVMLLGLGGVALVRRRVRCTIRGSASG